MIFSMIVPLVFFALLPHGDLTHTVSWWIFAPAKVVQLLVKVASIGNLRTRLLDEHQIYIRRSLLDLNIGLQLIDILLEAASLALVIWLGYLMDQEIQLSCV